VTTSNYDLTRTKRTAVSAFGVLGFAYVQLSRKRLSCLLLIYSECGMQYVPVLRLLVHGSAALPRYGMLFRLPDDYLHEVQDRLLLMTWDAQMFRAWQHYIRKFQCDSIVEQPYRRFYKHLQYHNSREFGLKTFNACLA
jgi:hypothetical protein